MGWGAVLNGSHVERRYSHHGPVIFRHLRQPIETLLSDLFEHPGRKGKILSVDHGVLLFGVVTARTHLILHFHRFEFTLLGEMGTGMAGVRQRGWLRTTAARGVLPQT